MPVIKYYQINPLSRSKKKQALEELQTMNGSITDLLAEKCYFVELDGDLNTSQQQTLQWILKGSREDSILTTESTILNGLNSGINLIEIGPRFNFSTADSTNSVSICHAASLFGVKRIENSTRYLVNFGLNPTIEFSQQERTKMIQLLSDKMTQCSYTPENIPKQSFNENLPQTEAWFFVPILEQGRKALEDVNTKLGLAFDNWDIEYYFNLFNNNLKRNPTSVELFDCAQSNSEHSRHWFFKGKMIIDGQVQEQSLIDMIIDTQTTSNQNNTIKFSDNSSAMKGFHHEAIRPSNFTGPGVMTIQKTESDLIFTAETHNMPTAVAPFSGATTGTGGRIRDIQGVGRGGHTIAGTAGYCVGNLNIPNYKLDYEIPDLAYPPTFAKPLKIILEASSGASDYGNKFGEPVLSGFAISYGVTNADNERDEYVKPIMFSAGLGTMDSTQTQKNDPKKGMLIAKVGGPIYRIGVGGGAASSVEVQGDNNMELDFNAVQRGDAEMENKLNRVIRACIEMGEKNPIQAIHDQGAGGNGNVLKEIVEPGMAGAVIFTKEFQLGDPTINALELWGAEYQENNAILLNPEDREVLTQICQREKCPINFVGVVTGNGFVSLIEDTADERPMSYYDRENREQWADVPFDMHLSDVLGEMPRKEYKLARQKKIFKPLTIEGSIGSCLDQVLSLMTVGSKRFLTNKVDRCVSGLVVQQQCCGPLLTPLVDYAATQVSYFDTCGIATSIGTQPAKGLLSPECGARMSVAEALSNLVFIGITELADVKCSGNWMWAAKLPGEGAKMYDACQAMCKMMKELNIAVDGGKDSLSMAARVHGESVKSPGTLVISTYAPCPDVRLRITPDLKSPYRKEVGELVWITIEDQFRLGGTALAQTMKQQGNDCPDLTNTQGLKDAFNVTQKLLKMGTLLAGHDISDGGLVVCLVEMAIAGTCGIEIDLTEASKKYQESDLMKLLFAEECGWILECSKENLQTVLSEFSSSGVNAVHIGSSIGFGMKSVVRFTANKEVIIDTTTLAVTKKWEKTSFELEKLQMNPECAESEYKSFDYRTGPKYLLTFNPDEALKLLRVPASLHKVAVVREEGINGDREMIAALMRANFEVHDVTMTDLMSKKTTLDNYRGIAFPGGFSYADTLGSAKGWASTIINNSLLKLQFNHFKERKETFSIGVCNGCQLMSLLGWVGDVQESQSLPNVCLDHNTSGRFECRWSSVQISDTNAMMLRRMKGTTIGCWTAHGEGKFEFRSKEVLQTLKDTKCIALQFVDDDMKPTEVYPMNPNGSIDGIAGICSKDGRHLALMPHPERSLDMYQWPYSGGVECNTCPWQSMFNEAQIWCNE